MVDAQPEDAVDGEFAHLLAWYGDIRNRALRGFHFEPVMLQEILAYEHFLAKSGIEMDAFDWEMIFRLDQVYMESIPKDDSDVKKRKQQQTRH